MKQLGYGTHFVGGVVLAIAVDVIVQTVAAAFLSGRNKLTQVVVIAAGAVYNRAENTLTNHIGYHKLALTVTAVFKHHAVDSGLFIGSDESPAVVKAICSGNLDAGSDSLFHCRNRKIDVSLPAGSDDDRVDSGGKKLITVAR